MMSFPYDVTIGPCDTFRFWARQAIRTFYHIWQPEPSPVRKDAPCSLTRGKSFISEVTIHEHGVCSLSGPWVSWGDKSVRDRISQHRLSIKNGYNDLPMLGHFNHHTEP